MPVEPGKIEPVTSSTEAHEVLDFIKDRLERDRLRLIEVQKFLIKARLTDTEKELISAVEFILIGHRRLNDVQEEILKKLGA